MRPGFARVPRTRPFDPPANAASPQGSGASRPRDRLRSPLFTARSQRRAQSPRPRTKAGAAKATSRSRAARSGPRRNVRKRAGNQTAAAPSHARTTRVRNGLDTQQRERRRAVGRRVLSVGMKVGFTFGLAYAVLLAVQGVHDYATTSPRFEVSSLIFEQSEHVDDDRLRELLALEPGTNILALDLEELSARVVAEPWVKRAEVVRQLPDTLEVTVQEHEESAVVLAGHFYLANGEGELFKQVEGGERGELPIITGIDRKALLADRDAAEARVRRGLEVLALYGQKQRPRLSEVHLGSHGEVTLFTAEAATQIRLGRGEVAERLERFDALRAALGERAEHLAVVHLDHEVDGNRSERVVASFFDAGDEASLLAAAAAEPETQSEPEPAAAAPGRQAPRKRLIPRAY